MSIEQDKSERIIGYPVYVRKTGCLVGHFAFDPPPPFFTRWEVARLPGDAWLMNADPTIPDDPAVDIVEIERDHRGQILRFVVSRADSLIGVDGFTLL